MLFYFIIHANYLLYFLMAKNIRPYFDHYPDIDTSCYIDEMSVVIGDVKLARMFQFGLLPLFAVMSIRFRLVEIVMYKIIVCYMSVIKINLNQMVHL